MIAADLTLTLDYEGFENYLIAERIESSAGKCYGVQYKFKFDNFYGASVIKSPWSYGHEHDLWELAVLEYSESRPNITYSTPITDDVLGSLNDADVRDILSEIKSLPDYYRNTSHT